MSSPSITLDDLPMAAMLCDAGGKLIHQNEVAEALLASMGLKKPYALVASHAALNTAFSKHLKSRARIKLRDDDAREWWLSAHGDHVLIVCQQLSDEPHHRDSTLPLSSHMAAALAHEIRNPLLSIKGAAKLLEDVVADAKDKALAELIHRETERVEGLMQTLDPLSPPAETSFKPLNIHEVIQHARAAVSSMAPHVRFVTDYDPSIPDMRGDHARLVQVMVNVFKNACEAMAATNDAQIFITTRVLPQAHAKRLHGKQQPVCISIRDTGPGISKNLREDLFTPFVSGNQQGKGLGLSIASAILHHHHGSIEYVPTKTGAQFHIYLPLEKSLRKAS